MDFRGTGAEPESPRMLLQNTPASPAHGHSKARGLLEKEEEAFLLDEPSSRD